MYWSHDGGWAWFWMATMMVVFWVLVAGVIVLVIRSVRGGDTAAPPPTGAAGAEEILAQRFARGEIDADEYHARLDALRSHART